MSKGKKCWENRRKCSKFRSRKECRKEQKKFSEILENGFFRWSFWYSFFFKNLNLINPFRSHFWAEREQYSEENFCRRRIKALILQIICQDLSYTQCQLPRRLLIMINYDSTRRINRFNEVFIISYIFINRFRQRCPPDSPIFKTNQSYHGNPLLTNRMTMALQSILHEYRELIHYTRCYNLNQSS